MPTPSRACLGLTPPVIRPTGAWISSSLTSCRSGVEQVRRNFERYGLMDDQVGFIVGWFKDTLTDAPVTDLFVLRLDGDLHESTIQALEPLYPKLSAGGYCIIDDYGNLNACASAVTDYRKAHGIDDEIIDIDGWGVYWRKSVP